MRLNRPAMFLSVLAAGLAQPCLGAEPVEPPATRPASGAANASQMPPPAAPRGWTLTVGTAAVVAPAWQGSRDMALSVFPDVRLNYEDKIFASIPDGFGWNAVNESGWKAGPIARIRFSRDEADGGSPFQIAGGSDALRGLGDVGIGGEAGGFVEKRFGLRGAWRVRAEVRHGFGAHEGVVADLSASHQMRTGRAIVSYGPRMTLASRDFMTTYFGIDTAQSQRSGLARYAPAGGLVSFGLGGTLIRPTSRRSAIAVFAGFDRLGSGPGNSPLVQERGRRNQFSVGAGYSLRFNL